MTKKKKPADLFSLDPAKEWGPHKYQKDAIKFLLKQGAAGLLLDPGLGKTSITLAAFKILKKKELVSKMLVLAPLKPTHLVWPKEIEKWLDFHELSYRVLHGPHKDQLLREDADIYICNFEGLQWLLGAEVERLKNKRVRIKVDMRRFKRLGFDILNVDELSKFKHTNTNRFKMLKIVINTFKRRWGLTGSPAANGLMGMFGQCYVLDEGRTFGPYITHYRNRYFTPSFDGFSWILKDDGAKKIYKAIKPLMLRISDDVLDMPKTVPNDIQIDFTHLRR